MASTPVERAASGREGAQDEEDGHRLEAARRELGLTHRCFVQTEWMDEPDRNDGEETDDEDHGGEQEGPGGLTQAAQVEQGDDDQDAQAERDGGPGK